MKPLARPRARKPRVDREHAEAVALMQIVRMHYGRWPELRWFAAIPNGGHRGKAAAGKLKAEGTSRGFPDYVLPWRSGKYIGLALELKAKGGRVEPEQKAWHEHLANQGWAVAVPFGAEAAWDAIKCYLMRGEYA